MAAIHLYLSQLVSKSPETLIKSLGLDLKECNKYWLGRCPIHQGDNDRAFIFYKDSCRWTCQSHSCHGSKTTGSIFTLVMSMLNCNGFDAVAYIKKIYDVDEIDGDILSKLEFTSSVSSLTFKRKKNKENKIIPEELIEIYKDNLDQTDYYLKRNYSQDTINYFEVGYCPPDLQVEDEYIDYIYEKNDSGNYYDLPFFHNRCTIPIHNINGKLIGFTGRSIDDTTPKFIHTRNMLKTLTLYNWHRAKFFLDMTKEIILTESPGVVWAWHQAGFHNVIGLCGRVLSDVQKEIICGEPLLNRIVIAMDSDKPGLIASKMIANSLHNRINVSFIKLKPGQDYDKMSVEEIKNIYNKRKAFINENV